MAWHVMPTTFVKFVQKLIEVVSVAVVQTFKCFTWRRHALLLASFSSSCFHVYGSSCVSITANLVTSISADHVSAYQDNDYSTPGADLTKSDINNYSVFFCRRCVRNRVFTRSSKRPANVQHQHVYFEYICWKFAGRLLDHVNTL